jgi:hypothetical protein
VKFYSSDGYDSAGNPVAKVIGMYGRIRNADGALIYGWFVDAWRYNSWAAGAWSLMVSSKPVP